MVLTDTTLSAHKARQNYADHTELIALADILAVRSCDDETKREHSIRIDTCHDQTFFFAASTNHEREQWIGQIGKSMALCRKE